MSAEVTLDNNSSASGTNAGTQALISMQRSEFNHSVAATAHPSLVNIQSQQELIHCNCLHQNMSTVSAVPTINPSNDMMTIFKKTPFPVMEVLRTKREYQIDADKALPRKQKSQNIIISKERNFFNFDFSSRNQQIKPSFFYSQNNMYAWKNLYQENIAKGIDTDLWDEASRVYSTSRAGYLKEQKKKSQTKNPEDKSKLQEPAEQKLNYPSKQEFIYFQILKSAQENGVNPQPTPNKMLTTFQAVDAMLKDIKSSAATIAKNLAFHYFRETLPNMAISEEDRMTHYDAKNALNYDELKKVALKWRGLVGKMFSACVKIVTDYMKFDGGLIFNNVYDRVLVGRGFTTSLTDEFLSDKLNLDLSTKQIRRHSFV